MCWREKICQFMFTLAQLSVGEGWETNTNIGVPGPNGSIGPWAFLDVNVPQLVRLLD